MGYGFGEGVDATPRATQLHLLSPDDLDGLPSTNLDSERHLSVFGKRSPVAKFINKMSPLKESEMISLYFCQQHSRVKKVKDSYLLLSFSMIWRKIGLIGKTNFTN